MPIYEYSCKDCGHSFEEIQKMSDDALVLCPNCGKESLQKLVSAAGFRLAGGGWYETDFKDTKETKRNLVDKNSSSVDTKTTNSSDK